ncbi:Uu.00g045370.m01.CDS01 [Anthostomella pinea]|uniref:Uu.00g045370.m01.CDS01 n=1 Tax=Anthostomella pinea TaxID=933095 RepID=A0AAI8VB17_9PEZI|nr:Uu.00g045370.m01.CDS01 [Anthostomella pinea]
MAWVAEPILSRGGSKAGLGEVVREKECNNTMMEPISTTLLSLPARDRISIWRNEVSAAQVYCVCSAPATATAADRVGSEHVDSASKPGEASTQPVGARHQHQQGRAGGFLGLGPRSKSGLTKGHLGQELTRCPVCASPTDGVAYVPLGSDGAYGLVRAAAVVGARFERRKLLKAVSGVFKGTRGVRLPKVGEPLSPTAPGTENEADRNGCPRRAGTEMYCQLRQGERVDGSGNDEDGTGSVATLVTELNEEGGRGKPRLGIDETAARLRRAQKLLEKSTPGGEC